MTEAKLRIHDIIIRLCTPNMKKNVTPQEKEINPQGEECEWSQKAKLESRTKYELTEPIAWVNI